MSGKKRGRGRPRDEELVARRRKEILTAGALFFAEFGYRNADIQVLAERLSVGKGTIYRYFPTKEALFFSAVDAGIRELVDVIDEALAGVVEPIEHMRKGIHAYLGFFDHNPHIVELLIIERAEFRDRKQATYFHYKEREHDRRMAFFAEAMDQGVVRRMDPERILRLISDTLYGVIFTNNFSRRSVPYQQQAEDVIEILFTGILTDAYRMKS